MNDRSTESTQLLQKPLDVVTIDPPPPDQRVQRHPRVAREGEQKNRYHLPNELKSPSPVGYRHRISFSREEAEQLMQLLCLQRPSSFVSDPDPVKEQELFEENSLGILTARQSTNFRGHKEIIVGPDRSEDLQNRLQDLHGLEAPVLDNATHTHVVFSRPYRTLFTALLTFVGHAPGASLFTVPIQALQKLIQHKTDIPSVEYLQHLHVGVLADELERAAVVGSAGRRRAQVFMTPFAGVYADRNRELMREIEDFAGLTTTDRLKGWRLAMVAQVGQVPEAEQIGIDEQTLRKFGANKVAFRSERIQPGVNQESKAPEPYQHRQDIRLPDELTVQCGRAAYNAFCHWTGIDRKEAKQLLLLERIDVLSEPGKSRLRHVRDMLDKVADHVIDDLPLWADALTGFSLSRNAHRGRKAFALAGQRIYLGGLDDTEIKQAGLDWHRGIRATGAASARAALYAEMMGCVELPEDCDLLAGICQMAGPVNQNDIGKQFYEQPDLLADAFPDKDPKSLLVWTLKAKTVADPIGNEEQLLNPDQKGALVELRPGPHEIIELMDGDDIRPMREVNGRTNRERAFSDFDNFAPSREGTEIPGNRGERWPMELRKSNVWE